MTSVFRVIYIKWRFRLKYWLSTKNNHQYDYLQGKKKCLVMLAADYGNLGDVAITYAQEKFLKEHFLKHTIVDVPISKTLADLKTLSTICEPDDIVTVVGGGNMSDLYYDIELLRQMVVKAFPNNRVILFPQTMFFSDTLAGRFLKNRARKIYSNHCNLTISSRERWSYMAMKKMIPNSLLVPDIVMTLEERNPTVERSGITLCLRKDKESKLSENFKTQLNERLSKNFIIADYDTHIGRGELSLEERQDELNKIWSQFRSSKWVITDRLHGMIFAYITGTPCVVLPNNNYKIEGCYNWIKNCGFILFLDNESIDTIEAILVKKCRDNSDYTKEIICKSIKTIL